jgi:hypothetical protein
VLYVPIDSETRERLRELARVEHRRPQDQAAVLIEQGLKARTPEPLRPTDPEPVAA